MKNFKDFLTELNRFEKKKGIDTKTGKPVVKGGTAKNNLAFQAVMKKFGNQRVGANEKKKVKAEKPGGGGKYLKMQDQKKQQQAQNKTFADRGKKAGFKSTQDYANTVARYGGEKNYKDPNKYGGLGT